MNQRILLAVVGEGGIVKQQYHEPSYDASQSYKSEKCATITFSSSPFYGQEGRIVKKIAGRHPEFQLEMPGGEKIRVDLLWTDYFGKPSQNPETLTHRIDFSQAQPIIRLLEYLKSKLSEDLASSPAADHSG